MHQPAEPAPDRVRSRPDAATTAVTVGSVIALHRFPVKSLVGERLEVADVEARGLRGDRLWAVVDPDGKIGSGKSTRRFRKMDGLLTLAASYDGEVPAVSFPDGRTLRGDDSSIDEALSRHVGRPVSLVRESDVSHLDEGPVHLVTTASVAAVEDRLGHHVPPRRFRANLVVDTPDVSGFVEDAWVGHRLRVGDVELEVVDRMPRCVMVDAAQVGLGPDRVLAALTELNDAHLGVVARVVTPGRVRVGASVSLEG